MEFFEVHAQNSKGANLAFIYHIPVTLWPWFELLTQAQTGHQNDWGVRNLQGPLAEVFAETFARLNADQQWPHAICIQRGNSKWRLHNQAWGKWGHYSHSLGYELVGALAKKAQMPCRYLRDSVKLAMAICYGNYTQFEVFGPFEETQVFSKAE